MPLHAAGDGLDPFLFDLISGGSVVEASPGVEPSFEGIRDIVTGPGDADVFPSVLIGFKRDLHIRDMIDDLLHPVADRC